MGTTGKATYLAAVGLALISLAPGSGPASSASSSVKQSPRPSQTSTTQKPTAAWMAAPPNPLTVAVTLAQGRPATETVTTRGGEITATAPDGTRFTLTIPKGALVEAAEITMTPVADVKNLPLSGGLVAAVQISPEELLLLKAPTLVVKTPAPIPSGDQIQFASFAYRGSGKEFHLYPMETDPKRIAFKLLHFGGFGVARGTEEEQEKIRARLPTDSLDRMMMQMQKLRSILRRRLLVQPAAQRAAEDDEWSLIKASYLRREARHAQDGEISAQMRREIVNNLRTLYQKVMTDLKEIRIECDPEMLTKVNGAISSARGWLQAVDLIGFIHRLSQDEINPTEIEMLISDRVAAEGLTGRDHQRRVRTFNRGGMVVTETEIRKIERQRLQNQGYTEQEVEELLKELESIRNEFQPMYDELNRLIWETLKKAYNKAHQCCMQQAKEPYLHMMDWVGNRLSSSGQEEAVSMEKRNECLCALQSVSGSAGQGRAWTGQITQTESFKDDRSETRDSGRGHTRRNEYHKKFDYRAVINLVYHERRLVNDADGSRIPAQVSASGTVISSGGVEDHGKSVSVDKRWGNEWKEDYSGNLTAEDTSVEVNIRPDGTYSVTYNAPCVEASGLWSSLTYERGTGFPEFQKEERTRSKQVNHGICPTRQGGLGNGQYLGITGQLDPSTKIVSGSKTFEVPLEGNRNVNRTITITWTLKRCK